MKTNKYKINNKRLSKYLYALGFDREYYFDEQGNEYWLFEKSTTFDEAMDFYFYMRQKNRGISERD